MIGTRLYIVADHLFLVKADETVLARMTNYEPFRTDKADVSDALFALTVIERAPVSYIEEWRQDEEGQETICGHTEDGKSVFEYRFGGKTAGWLVCTPGYRDGTLHLSGFQSKSALDNSLMIQFAMASACLGTVLFHAAVVPSISGKRWDSRIADGLHETENALAGNIPVWHEYYRYKQKV